ncbi:DNA-(apurinic or apyrimidinic site) lyase [Luteococcus japonicus]|uniref:Formamidopyrimidine-DNA glycosylase n=1 Tax=Luteococcus japonicus TaxID=33984 RepID=A0A3N1ZZ64_9ACTN|nr:MULTISPECIES: bifunctional DNA-formamidopyrimidine glycosylase/DNA-(apurinic or apyrimidinic site) lyase [Luteococcus]MDN5564218.1 bifunctional DNA-formamidopyrimidine glycosylase/DNA-(apurinic or apyrimidinic site) lyase [Luteococcus sp.]ROR55787.1 DNA-(apurinic or apyrimidinic site) lyase [Luteococcus japonicus]
MPELPEVETVRAGLEPMLRGRAVSHVRVLHPRPVRKHELGPRDFETTLAGRTFCTPRRRGKYLWFPFDDGDAMLAHLGMSGQFRMDRVADPLLRNTRVLFDLADSDDQLRFVDQRMFGGLSLSIGGAEIPFEIAHIAPDPFDEHFDLGAVAERMRKKRTTVKRALLDQALVSGIGNIYADEALWLAQVHPERPTQRLTRTQAVAVLEAARSVMAEALEQGGTSFDALYVKVNGESGYFDRSLNAYGQTDRPCPRCGEPIVRAEFMNRSSHFCPSCQRRPRPARG